MWLSLMESWECEISDLKHFLHFFSFFSISTFCQFFVTREFMLYHSSFKLGLQHSSTRIIKATNPKQYVDDVNEHDNLPRQNVQVNRNNDVGIVIEAENQPIAQVESFNEILAGDGGYTQFQSNSRNQSGESNENIKNKNNNNKAEHNLQGWWWPIFKWLEQDTW